MDTLIVLVASITLDLVILAIILILVGSLFYKSKRYRHKRRCLVHGKVREFIEKQKLEGEFTKNGFYWQLDVQDPENKDNKDQE